LGHVFRYTAKICYTEIIMIQETILLVLLATLTTLAALIWILWKPLTKRVWPYFLTWWNREKIAEAEALKERESRKAAEKEVAEWGVGGIEKAQNDNLEQGNQAYPTRVQVDSEQSKAKETLDNRQE
jgi:hypothetical protein